MTDSNQTTLTARQEQFCRHVAEGQSAARAARLAGYAAGSARQTGHDLLTKPDISVRIQSLRSKSAARRQAETVAAIEKLERVYDSARRNGYYGAAVRAIELQARLRGLLGDRIGLPPVVEPEEDPDPPTEESFAASAPVPAGGTTAAGSGTGG